MYFIIVNNMERTPLFSVLIANYNNGCFLKDAINSVLSQSYTNWEIIIVDDCSTDNTIEICHDWIEAHKERFVK